jgi:phospholipid/cholesterol/gamma-HCH transport system permease protein
MAAPASTEVRRLELTRPDPRTLRLTLRGTWRFGEVIPEPAPVQREIDAEHPDRLCFEAHDLSGWDSELVLFVARVLAIGRGAHVEVDLGGLPAGVQRMLSAIQATRMQQPSTRAHRPTRLERIGLRTLAHRAMAKEVLVAIGELTVALARVGVGRGKFRRRDLLLQIQAAGPDALGIVGLVSGLMGLVLAFISAVELQPYGAKLYTANLVGISIVREIGPVMTAIVVAGRTGAAFAAELGTMCVTQEIDALTVLGVSPAEFLVVPRVLAVTVMMPLLCVYADVIGVVGGAVVGITVMGVAPRLYLDQTVNAVTLHHLFGGIVKATTYGFLVAEAGCFMGLHSGRSAADVGKAATSAVVAGIVLVISACGFFAAVFYRLGL